MKIIHCAPFNIVSKIGAALYSNPVKISLGLIQNGHYVHNFDYRDTSRYFSIFKNKKNGATKMNQLFLECVDSISPDLIIFGHAELIFEETFQYIKNKNIKMIFWYNDMILSNHFYKISHLFDLVLITGAGEILNQLQPFNANSFFLPNPVDLSIEKHVAFEHEQKYDLLFSGRSDANRKDLIQFIDKNLTNINIKHIGQTRDTTIIGEKYFQLITNSKICLNHSRNEYMVYKWYTSDRLMHILGNGSFCLSRTIIDGEDFFEDKLDYYSDFDEMKLKILYYLENNQERIEKTKWLHTRVHQLFNAKRVGAYMIDLLLQNNINLKQYEWYK